MEGRLDGRLRARLVGIQRLPTSGGFARNGATIAFGAAVVVLTLVLAGQHARTVKRGVGFLSWDDSHYLARGLYHARQVEAHGDLFLPRLAYSLSFESPKPPLLVGWIALGRGLGLGFEDLLAFAATLPALFLTLGIVAAGWRYGGPIAGVVAAAAAWGSPQLYAMSFELMAETLLAGALLLCSLCFGRASMPGRGFFASVAAGLAGALCILTKLSAVPFAAAAIGVMTILVARREGLQTAIARAATVALACLAVAGPWFLRNGPAALRYFRESANWTEVVGVRVMPLGERIVSMIRDGLGLPVSLLLLGAGAATLLTDVDSKENAERTGFTAACGSGVAVLVAGLLTAPYFEPRYLSPAAPALAVVGAALLARHGAIGRAVMAGAAGAGLAFSLLAGRGLRPPEPTADVRTAIPAMRLIDASGDRGVVVAGSGPEWNGFKLAAAAEIGGTGARLALTDVAGMPAEEGMETARESGWIVVCDVPEEKLAAEPRTNRPYRPIRAWLEAVGSGFRRVESVALPPGVTVYRRPDSELPPSTQK